MVKRVMVDLCGHDTSSSHAKNKTGSPVNSVT